MVNQLCFFNDCFTHIDKVHIHPFDAGFLYGESVYDVIPLHDNIPLWLEYHLKKWSEALSFLGIKSSINWSQTILKLLSESDCDNCYIYLHASSGKLPSRVLQSNTQEPTIFITLLTKPPIPDKLDAYTMPDNNRCHLRHIKHSSRICVRQSLKEHTHHHEGIYCHDGHILEGGSSNIFLAQTDHLVTAPSDFIYSGVTREIIINIAHELSIPVVFQPIPLNDIKTGSCLFATGSIKRILPIRQLNDIQLSQNNLFDRLFEAYNQACEHYVSTHIQTQ